MSSLTEREVSVAPSIQRVLLWSRLAPVLSWLAVLLGVGFLLVFLFQAGLFAYLVPNEQIPQPTIDNPEQVTSENATLGGVDRDNQPYEVNAKRAWQDSLRPELVHLETVDATFRKATGEVYDVVANGAVYDDKLKELDLAGNVVIVQQQRFTARMDKAHVKVKEKKLTTDVPVAVDMPDGTINANAMQITNDGNNILFLNGVRARFGTAPQKGDGTP